MISTTPHAYQPAPSGDRWHRVTFRQEHARVSLTTNCSAAFDHACATLYAYARDESGPTDWHITIERTSDPLADSNTAIFHDEPTVEIGPRLYARVRHEPDRDLFAVDAFSTVITRRLTERSITVSCASNEAAVHFAARLVRQAMTAEMLAAGAVYAHTAALTHRGHGILIAGHRHRGKTTTLLAMLRHHPGDFVTNDRLLLHLTPDSQINGVPWPSHLRVGIGTLCAYPELTKLVPQPFRGLPTNQLWEHQQKISIEPAAFARLLHNGTLATRCHPRLMIWPEISAQHQRVHTEPVDPAEVENTLRTTRLFMTDPAGGTSSHINHWLIPAPSTATREQRVAELATALARTVPCVRLYAGADTTALARVVVDMLPGRTR